MGPICGISRCGILHPAMAVTPAHSIPEHTALASASILVPAGNVLVNFVLMTRMLTSISENRKDSLSCAPGMLQSAL
jgi:hypothetical protein